MGLILFLLILACVFATGWYLLPYSVIKPPRFDVLEHAEEYPGGLYPSDYGLDFEEEMVLTEDGVALKGYFVHSLSDNPRATLLLLHGIGGVKEGYLGISAVLAKHGFNSFLYDSRAHGQSGGKYCTFGAREKHDVIKILDHLEEKYGEQIFGIWGNSMGGAVALQTLEVEPRLRFGIIESTFADLRQVVYDYQKRLLKIGMPWVMDIALSRAAEIAGFDPDRISPARSAKNVNQPVFLAHGDADQRIRVAYARQIFANLTSPQKTLCIVKGGRHHGLYITGGQAYLGKIIQFLDKVFQEDVASTEPKLE